MALQGRFANRDPQSVIANPGVVELGESTKYSQVIVISDVHGMYDRLVGLLRAGQVIDRQNNWIAGNTLFVVTGDSIDKGPKSLEVMDLWIKLQSQASEAGGLLIHTLGNHEAEFLANPEADKKASELISELQVQNVPVTDLTSTQTPRGVFLHSEPVALKMGKWLFCHSGFYPNMNWSDFVTQAQRVTTLQNYADGFLIGDTSILEAKDWEKSEVTLNPILYRMNGNGLYGIVFGHQPSAFGIKGRSAAKMGGRLIKIDNGMAPEAGAHPGSLLVFTNPSQLLQAAYPQIKIIFPDGSNKVLQPE
ncbi:MAG TPA: metallophosphoesterase [Bdellovibrio sp.]|uniref:metallophosphoesterase n=1 Tax=Bdellovibrio sp. TaxID=28201 RepID=UPI002EDDB08C